MARKNCYLVVGFNKIDRKKADGTEVHGCQYSLQAIEPDEGYIGDQCEDCYIPDKYSTFKPAVGVSVRKIYNQWGKVEDLAVI